LRVDCATLRWAATLTHSIFLITYSYGMGFRCAELFVFLRSRGPANSGEHEHIYIWAIGYLTRGVFHLRCGRLLWVIVEPVIARVAVGTKP
jgi:hypothetical protein